MTEAGPIVARLTTALRVVEEAGIPADLHPVAFTYALSQMGDSAGSSRDQPASKASSPTSDSDSLLSGIAKRLGADLDVVTQVFEQEGEGIHLIVGKAHLPHGSSRAGAMRDVALLLAAGRQAAGLEDYTPTSIIRQECEEIGVLDSSNFSVEVARLGMRARGGSKTREVHANRHQLEEAVALMAEISGGGSA